MFARNRNIVVALLALFLLIGFALRVNNLGAESLSEDEFNKLQTIEEYRTRGLTARNGEHPFLMKGLQMVSIIVAERLNDLTSSTQFKVSEEAALRFPITLFGTFTTLLIFWVVSELFGQSIGLVSAALWAVEPMAIGFDRIGKEDSLVVFFFLLAHLFFIKSQTAAERGNKDWIRYLWAAATGFGALMASKYYPHLLAIMGGYYNTFLELPSNKWNVGKVGWLKFFIIMGVTFLILSPTILLPDTWREMLKFSSENKMGHDSYEYMGQLYRNQLTAWLSGVPWTFYYVFIAVKTSIVTLAFFLVGLPLMFKRKLGDGRFFVFLWAFLWFGPYTLLGGKFTRYFAIVEPLILITAAIGFYFSVKWLSEKLFGRSGLATICQTLLFAALLAMSFYNSLSVTPNFRLFTNLLGGGISNAGSYFPHDEFYDTSTREIVAEIAVRARPQAIVACETPSLLEYYARKLGREDLVFVSLSEKPKVADLGVGDFIVAAGGRRYFGNATYLDYLAGSAVPAADIKIMAITSARVYQLDEKSVVGIVAFAK